jgi:hypothetical protein
MGHFGHKSGTAAPLARPHPHRAQMSSFFMGMLFWAC